MSSYVIQKHDARRLHYDFRLEHGGVLWSWAVPKGPSLDPSVKRLAVRTGDHTLEQGRFEGIHPNAEFGTGAVMIWDIGTWKPEGDAEGDIDRGRMTFELRGQKLRGNWHLVRTRPIGKQPSWLLFKASDEHAECGGISIVDQLPKSAVSGRSLEEIIEAHCAERRSPA